MCRSALSGNGKHRSPVRRGSTIPIHDAGDEIQHGAIEGFGLLSIDRVSLFAILAAIMRAIDGGGGATLSPVRHPCRSLSATITDISARVTTFEVISGQSISARP
jgi:hypothetical protein